MTEDDDGRFPPGEDVATERAKAKARRRRPTDRGHEPGVSVPPLEADEALFDDGASTTIDPHLDDGLVTPPGTARPEFDPHARIDDNRRTAKLDTDAARARRGSASPHAGPTLREHIDDIHRKAKQAGARTPPRGAPEQVADDPQKRIDDSGKLRRLAPDEIDDHIKTFPRGQSSPPGPANEPFKTISMKTPDPASAPPYVPEKAARALPEVNLRAQSELAPLPLPPTAAGRLAPPRDAREVRSRRMRDVVVWACMVVILASVVTLAIWFLAGTR